MFCTIRAIIALGCTHRCQSSGDQKAVATFDHLTLALYPPLFISTVSEERVAPTAYTRRAGEA